MKFGVNMTVDSGKFDLAMKQYLLTTSRDLHKAINSRFFYLMVRLFVLVPPKSPGQERRRIADYLGTPVGDINRKSKKTGKRVGTSRILKRVHLITQARAAKNPTVNLNGGHGLYGKTMKKAASSFMRKAIGSVGYLRSAVVKSIRIYNRGFSQYSAPKWVPNRSTGSSTDGLRICGRSSLWQQGAHIRIDAPARIPRYSATSVAVSQACSAISIWICSGT